MSPRSARYAPIESYAAIGDCHGAALVGRDGSIDWCALRRFDAPPVFLRLLDVERGGCWAIGPQAEFRAARRYLDGTNVLRTVFTTGDGEAALTDLMPVGRRLDAGTHDYVSLVAPGWLIRRVTGLRGRVRFALRYRPSADYARARPALRLERGALRGHGVPALYGAPECTIEGDVAATAFEIAAGETRDFVLAANTEAEHPPAARVDEFVAATRAFWTEWIGYCRYRGPHAELVRRSALALKLMTYAPTGALVAALTTSLPEALGGGRNWDYRFCWLRDSGFALYALAALGYGGEARRFHEFLAEACRQTLPDIHIMYGIRHEVELAEQELAHLDGYASSRPVRIGNGAYTQHQIDVYGEILDLAHLYQSLGGELGEQYRRLLGTFAAFVARHWNEPDQGLWEMRGPPRHHVHGKLMSWAALDRAAELLPDAARWRAAADEVRRSLLAEAVDPEGGHLRQAYDGGVDAAVLLAPLLGFALDESALARTVAVVERELARGDYLLRYAGDDGLEGGEGAFLACSFWLVDAKLALGRLAEARALFERLAACANDVGLYAEEIEPASGAFLGNFPQAFTHLGLVGSAVNLELFERHGVAAMRCSHAVRVRRMIGATFGWRGVLAALRTSGRLGRIRSSRASMLAWP
ncbi:MAG: glycoside hydrolase family 15 protein [Burkholderiales bacterium]|nr:glycoside hydrolase family 15 protein [Burkholderiales bacterium]